MKLHRWFGVGAAFVVAGVAAASCVDDDDCARTATCECDTDEQCASLEADECFVPVCLPNGCGTEPAAQGTACSIGVCNGVGICVEDTGNGGSGGGTTTCVADLMTDPLNCGQCGHDCLGGECLAGMCQPVLLGAEVGSLSFNVVVVGDNLYWVSGDGNGLSAVVGLPTAGGTMEVLGDLGAEGRAVAVVADSIFATALAAEFDGGLYRMPITGGVPAKESLNHFAATGLYRDADALYYTERAEGLIVRAPFGGAFPTTIASGQNDPYWVAGNSTHLFWTRLGDGVVVRYEKQGGVEEVFATGNDNPGYIDASEESVCWADASTLRCATPAGASVNSVLVPYANIAVDGTDVYWMDGTALWRSPASDLTQATQVVSTIVKGHLAIDAEAIYWVGSNAGAYKLAKPPQ